MATMFDLVTVEYVGPEKNPDKQRDRDKKNIVAVRL